MGGAGLAESRLFKKSIQSSKLLFLFQLCDNFKGLEKSNKMVLMMHSGDNSASERCWRINSLGVKRLSFLPPPGLLHLGFYIFIVLKGRKRCRNAFRASSVASTEMNYSLCAVANTWPPRSFLFSFFFFILR